MINKREVFDSIQKNRIKKLEEASKGGGGGGGDTTKKDVIIDVQVSSSQGSGITFTYTYLSANYTYQELCDLIDKSVDVDWYVHIINAGTYLPSGAYIGGVTSKMPVIGAQHYKYETGECIYITFIGPSGNAVSGGAVIGLAGYRVAVIE